jgi:hypothetical protein
MQEQLRVFQDGTNVVIEKNGVSILNIPYETALALSMILTTNGKLAETYSKTNELLSDVDVVFRGNAGVLVNAVAGGIASAHNVGIPAVIQESRKYSKYAKYKIGK